MPTRVLYIDADQQARSKVALYYSRSKYAQVDTAADQHDALGKIFGNKYTLLVANYFGECSFAFLVLFTFRDGGMRAAVISDNEDVRAEARRNGVPNAPKSPVAKNLDMIIKAHRSGKLKDLGTK